MNPRLTAWLAALLLFNGVFNVPIARVATNRVSVCAAYSERKKLRADEIAEAAPESQRPALPPFSAGPRRDRPAAATFDSRLFQRPPPALSL